MASSRRRFLKYLGRFTALVVAVASGRFLQSFFSIGGSAAGKTRTHLGKVSDVVGRIEAAKDGFYLDAVRKVVLVKADPDETDAETVELHAISLDCTHLGCALRPVQRNRYLECPCHGSRFTFLGDEAADPEGVGQVLRGPATRDLKRYRVIRQEDRLFLET
jgi:Rieske Fe-S protein